TMTEIGLFSTNRSNTAPSIGGLLEDQIEEGLSYPISPHLYTTGPKGKGFTPSSGVQRRRGRCELGLVSAMVSLLQQDKTLYGALCPHVKLKLEATLGNVS